MIFYCLNFRGSTNTKKRKQPRLLSKLQMQLILIQLLRPILETFKNVLTFLFYQQRKQTIMKKIQMQQLLLKFQLKQYITLHHHSFSNNLQILKEIPTIPIPNNISPINPKNIISINKVSFVSIYFKSKLPSIVKTAKNSIASPLLTSLNSFNLYSLISIKLLYQGTER